MGDSWREQFKQIQLEMLKIFIDVCKEYDLQYFLVCGSCLGAIRHAGFIPWDDDIDVGMPREDYENFLEIARDKLPSHLFLQTSNTDPEYPHPFAKIRNSNTTYIETSVKNLNINHGVYLDVFPIDGISENKFIRGLIKFKKKYYNLVISKCFYSERYVENSLKKYVKKVLWQLNPDIKKAIRKRETLFCKYAYVSSSLITNFGSAWGDREIMPKDILGQGKKAVFEGIDVIVPEKYDEYLTRLYGDYMTPPPPEKRIAHHFYSAADMNKSYREYAEK